MNTSVTAAAVVLTLLIGVSAATTSSAHGAGQASGVAAAATSDATFKRRCAMCHAVSGKGGKLGPDLTGVVGRRAGAGAYDYSAAMKSSNVVWSAQSMDSYLSAPNKVVLGSRITVSVSSAEDRKAIIAYLASVKSGGR